MTCPDDLLLLQLLDDQLAGDSAAGVDEHLEQCATCQQRLEELTHDDTLRQCYQSYDRQRESSNPPQVIPSHKAALPDDDTRELTRRKYERLLDDAEREADSARKRFQNPYEDFGSDDSAREHGHPKQLGRFRLKRVLGKGGFGVVYLATDELLNRPVALKLPLMPIFADFGVRRRFLREGEAAGRLQHPNIVPVFEAGQIDEVCFLSSAYCPGPTLAAWLHGQEAPLDPSMAAKIMLPLAEAVQHAHDRDILHRDIKPGNILLEFSVSKNKHSQTNNLPFIPKLTDFGLAKTLDADADTTVTAAGIMLGTPRYFSPEQAAGLTDQVGPASDVYSLGVVLYELLTLRPAIEGDNNAATLTKVISSEPERPRRLVGGIPRDLEAICLKCLEKAPQHRYASAQDLADDLRRFLQGQSTVARPLGPVARFAKWSRRSPAWSALMLVTFLSLSVLGVGGWYSATTLRSSLNTTKNLLYTADVRLAAESVATAHARRAEELLMRHIPRGRERDQRGFVWHYLWKTIHGEQMVLRPTSELSVWCMAYSHAGKLIAGGDQGGKIWLWDTATGELTCELEGHPDAVRSVDFSPDDQRLISIGGDNSLRVWDLRSRKLLHQFQPHDGTVYRARHLLDGQLVATCGADQLIRLWRADTWQLHAELRGHTHRVYDIAVSIDGRWLVSGGEDREAHIWNLATGELEREFMDSLGGNRRYECVDISPDNKLVAVGTNKGEVVVWHVESGQQANVYAEHTSNVFGLAFSPDGEHLASASKDTTVHIRESRSGKTICVLQGHGRTVYDVCYSADGDFLSTCGKDGAIRIWKSAANPYEQRELRGIRAYRGEAGGRYVALGSWRQRPYVYDLLQQCDVPLHVLNTALVVEHAFSADGRLLAAANARFVDSRPSAARVTTPCMATSVDVDGDGDQDVLAAVGRWGHLIWQEADGQGRFGRPRLLRTDFSVSSMADRQPTPANFGNGTSCILHATPHDVRVYPDPLNPNSFEPRLFIDSLARPTCTWPQDMDLDGDQDLVVTTYDDQTVAWWENDGTFSFPRQHVISTAVTGPCQVIAAELDKEGIPEVAVIGEAGRLLVFRQCHRDDSVAWVAEVVGEDFTLPATMDACDVDQDGALDLLLASQDSIVWYRNMDGRFADSPHVIEELQQAPWVRRLPHNVLIWDLVSQEPKLEFSAPTDVVREIALSPDGQTVATAGRNDVIRLWDTQTGRVMKVFPLVRETNTVSDLAFSRDGKLLLFAAGDNAYVWNINSDAPHPRRLAGHNNTIACFVPSPTHMIAATTSHDYTVKIWDLISGQARQTLVGHRQQPVTAGFSPDGKLLATGGPRGEVILWDVETGQELLPLSDLRCTGLAAIQFVDERTLVAIGEQHTNSDDWCVRIGTWRAGE